MKRKESRQLRSIVSKSVSPHWLRYSAVTRTISELNDMCCLNIIILICLVVVAVVCFF